MSARTRINRTFSTVPVLPVNPCSKIVLFSDCHRGIGNSNDNFLKNQNLYFAALKHYYEQDFTYIELGDGDELWENRSIEQIKEIHSNVCWLLSLYYAKKRLWSVYGNHDIVKKKTRYAHNHFQYYVDSANHENYLFPDITFYPGLILNDETNQVQLFLTHGHQADFLNSVLWKVSRFLVRCLWQPLEHIGVLDPTSAAKNNKKKEKTERILTRWARDNCCVLVTGHTHRPMIGSPASPYFNTGSSVHPRCITCIEIEDLSLTLVKWTLHTRDDMTLYVAREELAPPVCISAFSKL